MDDRFRTRPHKAVIISGFPKSGTTLLLSLLDGHPELVVFPEEFKFLKRVVEQNKRSTENVKKAVKETIEILKVGEKGGMAAERPRNYDDLDLEEYEQNVLEKCEHAENRKEILLAQMDAFLEIQQRSKRFKDVPKVGWVIKRPKEYLSYHTLKQWFGNDLVWIHIERDTKDNFMSLHGSKRFPSTLWDSKKFAREYALMKRIVRFMIRRDENVHVISYEDLVNDTEMLTKRVCSWIGISFDPSMLTPTINGHPWEGNSSHGFSFSNVSARSIGTGTNDPHAKKAEEEMYSMEDSVLVRRQYLFYRLKGMFPKLYGATQRVYKNLRSGAD